MSDSEQTVRLTNVVLFFDLRNRQLAVLPAPRVPAADADAGASNMPPCLITFASLEALLGHELTPKKEARP